jgi:hypothetical protein
MIKQLVIIGIIILLVSVGLSGCNESSNTINPDKNKFVGTWKTNESTNVTTVFFSDGAYTARGINGTWEIKDGLLVIIIPDWSIQTTYSYAFSNDDRTLTLTDVEGAIPLVLTK